jgi:uncharacterized protein (TIGR02246 family)
MDTTVAIEIALRRLVDAWNRGDAEAFAERFAPDATYTTGAGQSVRGRAGISALVAGGARVALVDGPSVEREGATARGRFGWTTAGDHVGAVRRGTITCTLVRHGGSWLVESLRNEEATRP